MRLLDFLHRFVKIEIVIFRSDSIVPDLREIGIVESDFEKEFDIECLQFFQIPFSRIAVEPDIQFFLPLDARDGEIDNGRLGVAKFLHDCEAKVAADHDVLPLRSAVHDEGIDRAELPDAFFEVFFCGSIPSSRVICRRPEGCDFHLCDGKLLMECGRGHGERGKKLRTRKKGTRLRPVPCDGVTM